MRTLPSPDFIREYKLFEQLEKQFGIGSEQAQSQLAKAMMYAPEQVKQELYHIGVQEGFIPKPSGYDGNGNPIYDVPTIARHFGLTVEQVVNDLKSYEKEGLAREYTGTVNLMQ